MHLLCGPEQPCSFTQKGVRFGWHSKVPHTRLLAFCSVTQESHSCVKPAWVQLDVPSREPHTSVTSKGKIMTGRMRKFIAVGWLPILAVGHVRYWVLLLFLFRYPYRALFENSDRTVRKSHKRGMGKFGGCHRNKCWGLFCSEHSPLVWRRHPTISRVIPTKTFQFYLEFSCILVWAFPDCSLLVLGSSITNVDYSICYVSRNPSDLQDKSRRHLLWLWITERAGGNVLHSNQVLYKKKSELSFLNF